MRNHLLVAYDVRSPERLRRVHRCMLGYGDPLQYSVFACRLSPKERVFMVSSLLEVMKLEEDRVLIADLGPAGEAAEARLEFLGRPIELPERRPVVV